jgi:hypothetical protein
MNTTTAVLSLILALNSLPSQAAGEKKPLYLTAVPSAACTSGSDIQKRIKNCEDNNLFLERAKLCMGNFQATRKNVAAQMDARFHRSYGNAQTNNLEAKEIDSKEALKAHDYLIAMGELMMKEMDEYFDYFEHPDDIEAEEGDDEAADQEIWQSACYRENAEGLDDLMDELEDQINEMKKARAEEARHASVSSDRQDHLTNQGKLGAAKSTKGQSAKGIKTGKSKPAKSDVTGVEQDMKNNEVPTRPRK